MGRTLVGEIGQEKGREKCTSRPFCITPAVTSASVSRRLRNEDPLDEGERVRRRGVLAIGTTIGDGDLTDLDDATLGVLDRTRDRCVRRRVCGTHSTLSGGSRVRALGGNWERDVNDG